MSSGLKARKVSKELTFKLNIWQESNVNEISFIEMFKREENIEGTAL
jgi:hypothetical protein